MGRREESRPEEDQVENQTDDKKRSASIITYVPLIAAVIAAVGYIIVAIINRSTAITTTLKPIEYTQTAEAARTSSALTAAAEAIPTVRASTTPTDTPIPSATPTSVPPTFTATPSSPLAEVFPQVGDAQEYTFSDDLFSHNFVTTGGCTHTGVYGLQFDYKMQQSEDFGGWGVQWTGTPRGYFDASVFTTLDFWVKGASGGETFQIVLADTDEVDEGITVQSLTTITTDWTEVKIPLNRFSQVNLAALKLVEFPFYSSDGVGSICVDDISFVP